MAKRIASAVILAMLALTAGLPLPALLYRPDVPACCRSNGAHRCAMISVPAPEQTGIARICPYRHHRSAVPAPIALALSPVVQTGLNPLGTALSDSVHPACTELVRGFGRSPPLLL